MVNIMITINLEGTTRVIIVQNDHRLQNGTERTWKRGGGGDGEETGSFETRDEAA